MRVLAGVLLTVAMALATSAPPVVTFLYPMVGQTIPAGPFRAKVVAVDDGEVVSVLARVGHTSWVPCQPTGCDATWTCDLAKKPGPQGIVVIAFDDDGQATQVAVGVL